MALIWKVLLYLNITLSFLLAIRFYKTKYFLYFFIYSAIDPIIIALHYLIRLKTYYYMPVAMSLMLLALPIKDKKHVFVALLSTLLLSPLFLIGSIIPAIIASINACYIVYFLSEEILEEYRISSSIHIFLTIMIFDILQDNFKIYLYYQHTNVLVEYYTYFLIIGAIIPIVLIILGPDKKIFFHLNESIEKKSVLNESTHPEIFSIHLKKKGLFSDLTKREMDVLAYLALGFKPKEIAEKLFVEKKTVYYHLANIKSKLNISTTPMLAHFAMENLPQNEYPGKNASTKNPKN